MARWIIPDIHGCAKTLDVMLKNMLRATRDDELFFLGDYIDRGPNSKEVLDYLMDLQEGGWNIHCLKGNHEDYCVKAWEEDQKFHLFKTDVQKLWENVGAKETYKSFGVKRPGQIPEKYIEWMRHLLYYYEIEKYILVHAGMNFKASDPFRDTHSMINTRDFKVDYSKSHGKRIIHGHLPEDYGFIDHVIHNQSSYDFIALDNGVYNVKKTGMGNLMAFNPDTDELMVISNQDL